MKKFNQLDFERQERIKKRAAEIELEEETIKRLGEKLGISPCELVEYVEQQKKQVSSQQKVALNTIINVINALEGTMEIIIRVPNKEPIILTNLEK